MPRMLVTLGLILVAMGVFWQFGEKWGLGRLPGDLTFQKNGTSIHIPLMTCLIISVVLSAVMWILGRLGR